MASARPAAAKQAEQNRGEAFSTGLLFDEFLNR
jgi:hypothetical protein